MNKEALEALDKILFKVKNTLPLVEEIAIIKQALTQQVSNNIVIDKVNQAIHILEKHKNIANATYVDGFDEVSKDTKTIRTEIKRLREDIKSCDIIEVIPLIQPSNRSVKDYAQKHLLSHVDEIEKQLEIMNSKQEVSKDTNVEEVEEAIEYISDVLEEAIDYEICDGIDTDFEWKKICNYITSVPKDVPNQSAKEIKPPLMVLKTNVGNCVVCDNQVTSEENYCSECGVQLKELQND